MRRLRRQNLKRFFSSLALAGMLAHVVLITLHSTVVLAQSADTEQATLLSTIASSICGPGRLATGSQSTDNMAGHSSDTDADGNPDLAFSAEKCPVCSSLVDFSAPLPTGAEQAINWPRLTFARAARQPQTKPFVITNVQARAPPAQV